MIEPLSRPLLAAHVLAGLVALAAGFGAIVTRKGGPRHTAAGKVYALTMAVVVVTAVPLAVRIESPFLLAIAVFSGYLVFAGYRVVHRRRAGTTGARPVDWISHGMMIVAGFAMVGVGGWTAVTGEVGLAPVLVVFGLVGAGLAGKTLRDYSRPDCDPGPWFENHIVFMGGGYIATVTATVTVNLTMLPALVRWLGPTAVGVPLIVHAIRRYEPRFGRNQLSGE